MGRQDTDATLVFATAADFATWLDERHDDTSGVWLQLAKRTAAKADPPTVAVSLSYDEALRVALCYGWIDGQKRPLDDAWWLQRFTPRRARSRWSQRNCRIVEELLAAGAMQPAGQLEVDRAKADGRWEEAYDGPATMAVPLDLQAALDAEPPVAEAFAGLNSANRYAVLYRLQEARRPETRARRLEGFLQMLREGRTLHP